MIIHRPPARSSQTPLIYGVVAQTTSPILSSETLTIPMAFSAADGMAIEHSCLATLCWGGPLPDGLGRDEEIVDWLLSADFDAWTLPIETGDRVHVFCREGDDAAYVIGHERDGQTQWLAFREQQIALRTIFALVDTIRVNHAAHTRIPATPSNN